MVAEDMWKGRFSAKQFKLYQLEMLNRYVIELNSVHDVAAILENSARMIADMLDSQGCFIFMSRQVRNQLRLETAYYFDRSNKRLPEGVDETKGITGLAFTTGEPVVVGDTYRDPRATKEIVEHFGHRSVLAVPMVVKERQMGVVTIYAMEKNKYGEFEVEFLMMLASQLGLAVENARLMAKLKIAATTDALTGVYNHGYFRTLLNAEMDSSCKNKDKLSLIMLDINNFKDFNDTYGHTFGDCILKEVAGVIKQVVREVDAVARYGGDEFAVILPGTDEDTAKNVAERIVKAVREYNFCYQERDFTGKISLCYGIATYQGVNSTVDKFIDAADLRLYEMKKCAKKEA